MKDPPKRKPLPKPKKKPARPAAESRPLTPREARERELQEKRKKLKKRLRIGAGVAAALLLLVWLGIQPIKGPLQFGVCRAFLERELKFPQTLKMTQVEVFDKSLRMYYTYVDEFGSVKSEMLECDFRPFNSLAEISAIKRKKGRNVEAIDPARVAAFNKTVPAILAAKPDLVIPAQPRKKDEMKALKRDDY